MKYLYKTTLTVFNKKQNYLILLSAIILLGSCKQKKVSIMPQTNNITESVYASGNVKSKNQYEVFSKSNGILKKILVKEGDHIKKGDILFELDNRNTKFSVENAKVAANTADFNVNAEKLKDAENTVKLASIKLYNDSLLNDRQKNLWSNNVGTKIELEQRELNYQNSKVTLESIKVKYDDLKRQLMLASEQTKNNLAIAQTMDDDLFIRSDVDGIVYKINKEQGELVTSLSPIGVIGTNEFLVELNIDELDITKVKLQQQVIIRMDSYKSQIFEATLTSIDPMMNDRTRSFKAEATFTHAPPTLYPSLTVEANIVINTKQNVITIPRNYLLNDTSVMLENGDIQKVEIGLKDYNLAEIKGGINTSTKIVLPEK